MFNPDYGATATPPRPAARCSHWPSTGSALHRVIGRIDARNDASAAVLRRLGMRQEAVAASRTSGSRASGPTRSTSRSSSTNGAPEPAQAPVRRGLARSASRSSTSSMPTESRTRSAGTSSGEPATLACVIRPRVLDQRLDPAERLAEGEHRDQPAHLQRGLLAAAQPERHHAAEAAHLLGRDVVAGVRRAGPGRAPATTAGWSTQELHDALGVGAVPVHPHAEGLDAAQHQPGVERPGDRAHRVLVERELLAERRRPRRPARRRRRRSGRRGTSSSSARRRRRRARAAAAGTARRRCCRRRAARRRRARCSASPAMSAMPEQRVGRRLAPHHPGGRDASPRAPRRGRPAAPG